MDKNGDDKQARAQQIREEREAEVAKQEAERAARKEQNKADAVQHDADLRAALLEHFAGLIKSDPKNSALLKDIKSKITDEEYAKLTK